MEVGVVGETVEELGVVLDRVRGALAKPVLTAADFPAADMSSPEAP